MADETGLQNSRASLACTLKHWFTVILQSRASTGLWGSRREVCDASGGCMSTWVHIYTGMCLSPSVCVREWCSNLCVNVCVCLCAVSTTRQRDRPPIQAWQCDWIQGESQWSNEYLTGSSVPSGPPRSPQDGPSPACLDQMESWG